MKRMSPGSTSSDADRRETSRYHARFDVRFSRPTDAAKAFNAFSVNFSAGGLCLRSKTLHVLGELLHLDLSIANEQFSLEGVVAWVRGEAVGVRFVNVRPALREQLDAVARTLATNTSEVGRS